ncbi:glycosyl hydrolase family 18 protein [Haloechinothrix halophila]|uniref:glycosyl hydrolase family 18 protein n=1 Tax=Haloechinothrix halophila TaxID=1069073 RepID=UPI0003FD400B|nr:glycosyl hydrolase family 18 protein [Haloechinothrix halophila]
MSTIRWHLVALFVAIGTVITALAVVPASGATGVTASFSMSSDWGTGYEGKYTISNGSSNSLSSWTVEFDLPAGQSISSLWDGDHTVDGQHVTVNNKSWNGTVEAGGHVSFGFVVTYSGESTPPTGCLVNGEPCDGGTPPPTTTTTPPTTTTTTTTSPTTTTSSPDPTTPPPDTGSAKNLGYFTEWGVYGRDYHVKDIVTSGSADKLTHINYAFGNVQNGECTIGDSYAAYDKFYDAASSVDGEADTWDAGALRGNFNQLRKLKEMHPDLKILWSFGGWTWSGGFGEAARNPAAFAESCYQLVEDPRWADVFDGIDIDWEYPNACGKSCDDSGFSAYKDLMGALRDRFGSDELVTAAITADASSGGKMDAADYAGAAQYVDWYNVMTYDFFGAWASQGPTAPHSPLTAYDGIPQQGFNTDDAIQKLTGMGIPSEKLLLGIGFYGRGWTGVTQSEPGGSASGAAPGTYEKGVEDYKVLTNRCPATGTVAGTAYAHCGEEWWSYDTPSTIGGKMSYVRQHGLGGAFFWELSGDTTDGELITAIAGGLG